MKDLLRPWQFNASAQNAEIMLYGYVGEGEAIDAADFAASWASLEEMQASVRIRMHSGGGSVYDGLAIYNIIKNTTLDCSLCVDGIAGSMGSVIMLAVPKEKRSMYATSRVMTHAPAAVAVGRANDMRQMADQLDAVKETMAAIYTEATGADAETVATWMPESGDMWWSADKAKAAGLVGQVLKGGVKIKASILENPRAAYEQVFSALSPAQTNQTMLTQKASAMLVARGFAAPASQEEDVIIAALEAALTGQAKEIATLTMQVEATAAARAQALVDAAVTEGKIAAEGSAGLLAIAKGNYDAAQTLIAAIPTPGKPVAAAAPAPAPAVSNALAVRGQTPQVADLGGQFKALRQTNPKALEKMQSEQPELFEAMEAAYTEQLRADLKARGLVH